MIALKPGDTGWYPIPKGHDICPCCNGTGIGKALTEADLKYSWNKGKTHFPCFNCGAQTMGGRAHGHTKIDPATGKGCSHTYVEKNGGRCYHIYTCSKCQDRYDIDSSD